MKWQIFKRVLPDSIFFWLFLLLLYGARHVKCQECLAVRDAEDLKFDAPDTHSNIPAQERERGALSPLFRMVEHFLDAVQPNQFPKDLLRIILNNASSLSTSEVARYEAGYVTCAVITVLFLVFMLVFGITFCSYEYRRRTIFENCDGVLCQRTPVFSALLVTCLIFAGLVLTFYLNQRVKEEVGPGVQDIRSTLQNFRHSLSSIPQALEKVIYEFNVPKNKVFEDLEKFGPAINRSVVERLNEDIYPRLQNAYQTAKRLERAAQIVVDMNITLMRLQQRHSSIMTALVNRKEKVQSILSDPRCENCNEAASILQRVQLTQNYSQVPSLDSFVKKLSNVRKINLTGLFQQGMRSLNEMPKLVTSQTSRSTDDVRNALNSVQQEINLYASNIPIRQYIDPISKALLDIEYKTSSYGQDLQYYDYYRWIVGIVLSSIILVIVVCTLLGLMIGVWGLYLKQDPIDATLRQRIGAGFLIVDVYLTFSFSWLLISLVFVTFLVGGNVQTLLCRHWDNKDIYRFLDDPRNLPQNVNLKKQLGLKDNSSFTDMYQQCKGGAAFWDVLKFQSPIDLDSAFNITKYTADLQFKINNFTVDVRALTFFTRISILVLTDYKNSGIDQVPFSGILAQIQTPLLTEGLGQVTTALEQLAAIQSDSEIKIQLENEVAALRDLQNSTLKEQEADVERFKDSLQSLANISSTLQAGIDKAISDVQDLQGPVIQSAIWQVKNESSCLLQQAIKYFTQYLDWVKKNVIEDISSCRSVSVTLDNARVIVCNHITDPWNGFWFCLGWCTFLLIPNIILSIKAVQHITPFTTGPLHTCPKEEEEEENLFSISQDAEPKKVSSHGKYGQIYFKKNGRRQTNTETAL
ncbi:prominin-2 [Bombina bombina]|uniref:prominin-2 n=1 Tax=Bombina bombina TaxID=8345 RepID=UPI00235B19EE|nr:prominin-2 [Bombina bombina]